jgi:hypothetical protein
MNGVAVMWSKIQWCKHEHCSEANGGVIKKILCREPARKDNWL